MIPLIRNYCTALADDSAHSDNSSDSTFSVTGMGTLA